MTNPMPIIVVALAAVLTVCSFYAGVDHSRRQIRDMAEDLANSDEQTGTNSFSRCLTEMWEQTGELNSDWKGQRKWRLEAGE